MKASSNARRRWLVLLPAVAAAALLAVAGSDYGSIAIAYAQRAAGRTYTVEQRLEQFGEAARMRLAPHFQAAGVALPPREIALLAFKDSRTLQLYARDRSEWRHVRDYPVRAASGLAGPKLREGDYQVPEGRYRVTFLNANSQYHVSLRLDYPNAFDREMARRDGRTRLGGDIMIHGKSVSIGCLAMGDEAAEELFALAAWSGTGHAQVLIAPTDFRRGEAALRMEPPWVAQLYDELREALKAYPVCGSGAGRDCRAKS